MLQGRLSKSGPRQNFAYGTLFLWRFDLIWRAIKQLRLIASIGTFIDQL